MLIFWLIALILGQIDRTWSFACRHDRLAGQLVLQDPFTVFAPIPEMNKIDLKHG